MNFNQPFQKIWGIWERCLDLCLPLSSERRFFNNLTAEEFLSFVEPADIPPVKNTFAIVSYKNKLVKQAVWLLKFKNDQKIAKLFAEIIYDALTEELADLKLTANFDNPLLTPIPLSRQRLKKRGYNQAELIASEMAKIDRDNFFEYKQDLLKKIKDTPSQSRARNKKERLENLKDCFEAKNPADIKRRNIIILDDITTTGATLSEAKKTLRVAGANQIFCVTLAH